MSITKWVSSVLILAAFYTDQLSASDNPIHRIVIDDYGDNPGRQLPVDFIGNRTLLNTDNVTYTLTDGCQAHIEQLPNGKYSWEWAGSALAFNTPLNAGLLFNSLIKTGFLPEIVGFRVYCSEVLNNEKIRPLLEFKFELKNSQNELLQTQTFNMMQLTGMPNYLEIQIDSEIEIADIASVSWVLDRAGKGDTITIDSLELGVQFPQTISMTEQAILAQLNMLLTNYDQTTGMVADRNGIAITDFENVTATGKLAKILAMAITNGLVDAEAGKTEIIKIANRILALPQGPPSVNTLLPHFTRNGGSELLSGSEWSTVDTAITYLDVATALQMIGDPDNQLSSIMTRLEAIDWEPLYNNGSFSHGYYQNGSLIPYYWQGFGAETMTVLLAARIADPQLTGTMQSPPTDNGSGFIPYLGQWFRGTDRFDNNWTDLKWQEAAEQVGFYFQKDHYHRYFTTKNWFGLSAAEVPDGNGYSAYGTGGKGQPLYQANEQDVVVSHYAAMISPLLPDPAEAMYTSLISENLFGPLINLESLSIDTSDQLTVNTKYLSWNLTLALEGWLWSDTTTADTTRTAFLAIPQIQSAYEYYFPPDSQTATNTQTILFPQGDLKIPHQAGLPIIWQPVNTAQTVTLYYTLDAGATWDLIGQTSDDGYYLWQPTVFLENTQLQIKLVNQASQAILSETSTIITETNTLTAIKALFKPGKSRAAQTDRIVLYFDLASNSFSSDDLSSDGITVTAHNPYGDTLLEQTITVTEGKLSGNRFSYNSKTQPIRTFKLDFNKETLYFYSNSIDLTGLTTPLFVWIRSGQHLARCVLTESAADQLLAQSILGETDITVNSIKPIPLRFLAGYDNKLRVARHSFKSASGSLSIKGELAIVEPELFLVNDTNIHYGENSWTLPHEQFSQKGARLQYTRRSDIPVNSFSIDTSKCTFSLKIKDQEMISNPAPTELRIWCNAFDETVGWD